MVAPHEGEIPRDEAEAVLEARRELGPSYDEALVDSFADRVERAVAHRVDARLAAQTEQKALDARGQQFQFTLAVISLVAMIPISIVLATTDNFASLVVALLSLVAVNVAHAAQRRRR